MNSESGLSFRARMLIATVAAAGALSILARIPEVLSWGSREVAAFGGLALAIAVVEMFPLSVHFRTEILYLSLTDALWTAALLLFMVPAPGVFGDSLPHPSVLVAGVGVGALVGQLGRRRAPVKIAFNVGQFLLSISVAELAFRALGSSDSVVEPLVWVHAAVAMAACFALNATLTATVISLVAARPFHRVILGPLGPNLFHWAGNFAMGVVGAVMWERVPIALPLLLVPLALSYFAYRTWLQGMHERDRMRNLYEASSTLVRRLDLGMDFRPFLARVSEMLDAEAAELVVLDGDRVNIHAQDGTVSLTAQGGPVRDQGPQAYVRVRAGVSPQLAQVGGPDEVAAVLAVYRRVPLSSADGALLEALVSQVRVRLVNVRLYAQMEEQRSQLEDVISHTSDGIFLVSPEDRIVSWNPAMERITGSGPADAVGRTWHDVFGARDGGEVQGSDDTGARGDILLVRADGAERWIRYTRTPVRDTDGSLKAAVVVARDVTADLESERLKADFVATVSHELRTPLTPLKGFLVTLLSGTGDQSPEARREYYRIMKNQTDRLERLIKDLLEVSRIEGGQVPVDRGLMDLTDAVEEQLGEIRAQHLGRRVELRAPAGPVYVDADRFRVGQVMDNLLSNAMKYSDEDRPVEVTVASAGLAQAIVSVRDEGEGIPMSEQERVFDRFHRVEGGLTRRTGGTGLGLYIARRLVEAMGGRLWLVSSPGQGSTFSFSLPAAPTPATLEPRLLREAGVSVSERAAD